MNNTLPDHKIEFMAWDKRENKMYVNVPSQIMEFKGNTFKPHSFWGSNNIDEYVGVMQLTALRSTTGEKIYNHMIVKDEESVLYVVDMFNYYDMNVLNNHDLEIVGNRFQNPELLELCK